MTNLDHEETQIDLVAKAVGARKKLRSLERVAVFHRESGTLDELNDSFWLNLEQARTEVRLLERTICRAREVSPC